MYVVVIKHEGKEYLAKNCSYSNNLLRFTELKSGKDYSFSTGFSLYTMEVDISLVDHQEVTTELINKIRNENPQGLDSVIID